MPTCSAFGCTNRSSTKYSGLTFHRFPKNEHRRTQWIIAVRRKNWSPSKYSVLCIKHFSEDMIDRSSVTTVRLKENAVPTIFTFPSHFKKECKQHKPLAKRVSNVKLENDPSPDVSLTAENMHRDFDLNFVNGNINILTDDLNNSIIESTCQIFDAARSMAEIIASDLALNDNVANKRKIEQLEANLKEERKKVKVLQQTVKQYKRKINNLAEVLEQLIY